MSYAQRMMEIYTPNVLLLDIILDILVRPTLSLLPVVNLNYHCSSDSNFKCSHVDFDNNI